MATSAIPDELCCCIQAEVFASTHEAQREKQASFGGGCGNVWADPCTPGRRVFW